MKLLVLFLAPALYAQVPGLVTVQAGALSCGAVMRAANQVQTYCYATAPNIACNYLNPLNLGAVAVCLWCTPQMVITTNPNGTTTTTWQPQTGCTPSEIGWEFQVIPGGIWYQYTISAGPPVSGTLTKVYGSP